MTTQTKSQKTHAAQLHFEHNLWLNQLSFYKQELGIFQKRLQEVTSQNTTPDFRRELSHLQNQIIIQQEQADIHLHNFKELEHKLQNTLRENPILFEHGLFEDHTKERHQMERFIEIYEEFKKELNQFLIHWM